MACRLSWGCLATIVQPLNDVCSVCDVTPCVCCVGTDGPGAGDRDAQADKRDIGQ